MSLIAPKSTKNYYRSLQDVRWCSGCGDFHVLNALTSAWSQLQIPRENIALISGIGCSSRLPYYCSTYGFHTIHGRAPTVAYGLHRVRPELSIWVITGDGDGLSIGGNHLIHLCRRNPNITVLLFNNEIYGLTKGQSSPTSSPHLRTRSSPRGTTDQPICALSLTISSGASFAARVIDTDLAMMRKVFCEAHHHHGLAFIEILTSCVVFNEEAFKDMEKKQHRNQHCLLVEPDKPLIIGTDSDHPQAVVCEDFGLKLKDLHTVDKSSMVIHNPHRQDPTYSLMLAGLQSPHLAFGIIRHIKTNPQPSSPPPPATPLDQLLARKSFQRTPPRS